MHDKTKAIVTVIKTELVANPLIIGDTKIDTIYREYDTKPSDEHIVIVFDYDNLYDTTQLGYRKHTSIHFDCYANNSVKSVRIRDEVIERFQLKEGITQLKSNLGVARLDNGKFVCRASGRLY